MGECAWCKEIGELEKTHSIPRTYYKRTKRASNGQALRITDEPVPDQLGNFGGGGKLLCRRCEDLFNRKYDKPSIEALAVIKRKLDGGARQHCFKIDYDILSGFLFSILWREALLPKRVTDGFSVCADKLKSLSDAIEFGGSSIDATIRMTYLYDDRNVISNEQCAHMIIRPRKLWPSGAIKIVMGGFTFEIWMIKQTFSLRREKGMLLKRGMWNTRRFQFHKDRQIFQAISGSIRKRKRPGSAN